MPASSSGTSRIIRIPSFCRVGVLKEPNIPRRPSKNSRRERLLRSRL
jgi:hypothetical protein